MNYAFKMMAVVLALGVLGTQNIVQSANIIGCSNCNSKSYKSLGGEIIGGNLKEDEHLIFWDGFLETDELTITNKGIIRNSQFLQISDLNNQELCKFGMTNFPSKLSIYADELANDYEGKRAKKRYFTWSKELSKRSLNLKKGYCKSTREAFINSIKIDAKYQCHTNVSACKIKIISFDKDRRITLIKNKYKEFEGSKFSFKNWTDERVCFFAANENKTGWSNNYNHIEHVQEAKKRKLDCFENLNKKVISIKNESQLIDTRTSKIRKKYLTFNNPVTKNWCYGADKDQTYIEGSHPLPGAKENFNPCPGKYLKKIPFAQVKLHFSSGYGNKWICSLLEDGNILTRRLKVYFELAKEINLECEEEVIPNSQIVIKEDKESKKLAEQEKQKRIELEKKLAALEEESKNKTKVEETSKRLAEEEKQKRKELEEKLALLSKKNNVNVDKLVEDNSPPIISAQSKQDGFYADISGTITDDVKLAEVLIDNKLITPNSDGSFNTKLYVPRNGLEVKILAFDMKGNKSTKTLTVERGAIEEASGPIFASLDPSAKKVKLNPNALALIVGVAKYSKTNADAIYADKDAQQFYDYARMKLGIPAKNIKELVNNKADESEILLAIKDWLRRSTKPKKSDVYIFFAGHGLASEDGKNMFLLPYDGSPRLLEDTAILRDRLFADIKSINPKSVTVFLDTCYSGTTRGTDMLIASRPIAIRALEQSIPSNFTVFSAAAGDQTSKPLEEAKHGMFSYFLMKGMEGDADTNADNKITAQELHNYVKENVTQQSSGSQTPELQGDKDRVLVQFN